MFILDKKSCETRDDNNKITTNIVNTPYFLKNISIVFSFLNTFLIVLLNENNLYIYHLSIFCIEYFKISFCVVFSGKSSFLILPSYITRILSLKDKISEISEEMKMIEQPFLTKLCII